MIAKDGVQHLHVRMHEDAYSFITHPSATVTSTVRCSRTAWCLVPLNARVAAHKKSVAPSSKLASKSKELLGLQPVNCIPCPGSSGLAGAQVFLRYAVAEGMTAAECEPLLHPSQLVEPYLFKIKGILNGSLSSHACFSESITNAPTCISLFWFQTSSAGGSSKCLGPAGNVIGTIKQVEGFRIYNQMTIMLCDISKPVSFSHLSSGWRWRATETKSSFAGQKIVSASTSRCGRRMKKMT